MSHTPPSLKITAGPQPFAKLKLRAAARAVAPTTTATFGALAFGRAIDASYRDDIEYLLGDRSKDLLRVARSLKTALAQNASLAQNFAGDDAVTIGVGLERLRLALSGQTGLEPRAIEELHERIATAIIEDEGLSKQCVSRVLSYASLELYYRQGATASAKRRLDAMRNVVQLAAGKIAEAVNPSELLSTAIPLTVWEGWQAVRGLAMIFELSDLAQLARARGATQLSGLLLGASAILDAILSEQPGPPQTTPRVRDEGVLPPQFKSELSTPEARPPQRGRALRILIADVESQVERYRLLLDGDENSLVFEVAPLLEASLKELYRELEVDHPQVAAGLWKEASTPEVLALRAQFRIARDLFQRFHALREDMGPISLTVPLEQDTPVDWDNALPDTLPNAEPPKPDRGGRKLEDVVLSDSPVTSIHANEHAITFELDVLFTDGTRARGAITFAEARSIRWLRVSFTARLGVIEHLDQTRVRGAWGEVELEGGALRFIAAENG